MDGRSRSPAAYRRRRRIQRAGVEVAMTFAQIPAAAAVFLDANTLIYHFTNHPTFGPACTQLVKRIEKQHLTGFISTHFLSLIAHRLMTLEALDRFGWPPAGLAAR